MNPLETLTEALDAAQNELKEAEIAHLNTQVRVEAARIAASRLENAVAALKGDISAPPEPQTPKKAENVASKATSKPKSDPNNPYRDTKCPGCGKVGQLRQNAVQAPSGAIVNMLTCGECNNQMMMG